MIKSEFDKEKLQKYISLLQGIVNTSVAVFDTQLSPIIETDSTGDPAVRAENLRKNLLGGNNASAMWILPDETAEIAAPVFRDQTLFAYVWIGNLYFEANANPHTHLMRENRPVYDRRSIRDIMEMLEFGVQLFLRDIYDVDPELRNKVDQYISCNLDKKITFHILSAALKTDIKVLRALFNDELKCDLPDYLSKKRIDAAKQLLTETDLPLSEISEKIGMTKERFDRLFLKTASVSPETYRKDSRK